ncbi:hypothetical protein SAVIM338S_06301 [Streptomyces avidinii]
MRCVTGSCGYRGRVQEGAQVDDPVAAGADRVDDLRQRGVSVCDPPLMATAGIPVPTVPQGGGGPRPGGRADFGVLPVVPAGGDDHRVWVIAERPRDRPRKDCGVTCGRHRRTVQMGPLTAEQDRYCQASRLCCDRAPGHSHECPRGNDSSDPRAPATGPTTVRARCLGSKPLPRGRQSGCGRSRHPTPARSTRCGHHRIPYGEATVWSHHALPVPARHGTSIPGRLPSALGGAAPASPPTRSQSIKSSSRKGNAPPEASSGESPIGIETPARSEAGDHSPNMMQQGQSRAGRGGPEADYSAGASVRPSMSRSESRTWYQTCWLAWK